MHAGLLRPLAHRSATSPRCSSKTTIPPPRPRSAKSPRRQGTKSLSRGALQGHAQAHRRRPALPQYAHLIPKCPHADLFGRLGRAWLTRQPLPDDERAAIERHIRELDRLSDDLEVLDREIAEGALDDGAINRLLTITGVNLTVAAGLVAAIGNIARFKSPQKLVSYFGLNPRVRQSGLGPAHHGRISKVGRSHARAMLVEAAWAAAKTPGPLHAFFVRIRAKRGHQVAAVAVARKLAVLVWHMLTKETDYLWARPSLVAHKMRGMELQAGKPQKKGNRRGPAYAYSVKELRNREMRVAEQAQKSYQHFVEAWRPRPPKGQAKGEARERLNPARNE